MFIDNIIIIPMGTYIQSTYVCMYVIELYTYIDENG